MRRTRSAFRTLVSSGLVAAALLWTGSAARGAKPDKVNVRRLAGGLTLLFQRDISSPLTSLTLLIKGGQMAEPKGQAGLAFLATRLLLEIPDSGSAQVLMKQASSAGMAVEGDFSLITIESLSVHFEEALRIMSGPMLDPLFSALRVEDIKRHMLDQGSVAEDDPARMAHEALRLAVFGGSAYGSPVLGTEASLKSIRGRDAEAFYKARFRTDNMVLAVISDLPEDEVASAVEKSLKGMAEGPAPTPSVEGKAPEGGTQSAFLERQTRQTVISYGFPIPGITLRSYALATLAETLVGKGPGSRLWPLRQEKALAYNIDADVTLQKEGGLLEVFLETDDERKDAAAAGLRGVLAAAATDEIAPAELAALKAMAGANFLRDNETKDRRCPNLAVWEAQGLGADALERLPAEIETISAANLNAYLKEVLDLGRAKIVVVGPRDVTPASHPDRGR